MATRMPRVRAWRNRSRADAGPGPRHDAGVPVAGTSAAYVSAPQASAVRVSAAQASAADGRRAAYAAAMDRLLAAPAGGRTVPVAGAGGDPLHVEVHGPVDGVPIVLSHGWACSTRMWNPQVGELASRHRVICYDQRGHGSTPVGTAPATLDTLADDLAAVVRAAVAPGERAVVVGHSMGGMTVNAWAARHPDDVPAYARGVLLASTAVDRLLPDFGVLPLPERVPGALAVGRVAMAVPVSAMLLPARGFHYASMGTGATAAQIDFCRGIVNACRARDRGRWGSAMARLDVRAGLDKLTVPTTVVVGTADRLTPPVHSERMADVLAGTGRLERNVELDGIGHMSSVEAPFEFNAQIRHLAQRPAHRS